MLALVQDYTLIEMLMGMEAMPLNGRSSDLWLAHEAALDQLAVHTFSWIIALRAPWLSVDPAKRYDPPPFHLRPHEVEKERRTILLLIGFRFELGGVGVEGH